MLEEIMLDKARIVSEAADEWALASATWDALMADPTFPWADPTDVAIAWMAGRVEKVLGMTEVELRRTVKRYLNSWAQAARKRQDALASATVENFPEAIEWPGMVADLTEASRMARRKAGKKNLTPWVAPKGQVTVAGESIDYTSYEFWTDMYLYGLENPQREGEGRTSFLRRMGDAGANAKYASEKMPQGRNGIKRSISLSASPDESIAATMRGQFDGQYQTVNRPIGQDRRPMDLRDEDWMDRPVTTRQARGGEIEERRAYAKKRFATEPIRA